ncbi:MAG: response regulator, partial [Anaerolineae bacterium]
HLLILDLRMPGLDGFQVCKRVKEDPATRSIKILAITAYPENNARERILTMGADVFFEKPIPLEKLQAEVARLIKAHRWLRS